MSKVKHTTNSKGKLSKKVMKEEHADTDELSTSNDDTSTLQREEKNKQSVTGAANKKKDKNASEQKNEDNLKYHRKLTDAEKTALEDLRARLSKSSWKEKEDLFYGQKNDGDLVRFLTARNFDVEATFKMYTDHLQWRETFKPDSISEDEIAAELKIGKMIDLPADKHGRPTVVLLAGRHIAGQIPIEVTIKYIIYKLEKTIKNLPPGIEKINFVWDRTGFTRKNFDQKLITGVASLVEANYPERVSQIFVLYSNWLFNVLYALVKPWLAPATQAKIKVLGSEVTDTLLEFYEKENLWERYGGDFNFELKDTENSKKENSSEDDQE